MIEYFLVGVAAGFPLWFSAGWLAKRDEYRQLARQRDRRRPRPARPLPRPTPAHAQRTDQRPAAPIGGGQREVSSR